MESSNLGGVKMLIKPNVDYLDSYLEACVEFLEDGLVLGSIHNPNQYSTWKDTIFIEYENNSKAIYLKEGIVPSTTFWFVNDGKYIGTIIFRHYLNEFLETYGGHVGYAVRPKMWSLGYATKMLSELIIYIKNNTQLNEIIITCDHDNKASQRVIEKNKGELISEYFHDGVNKLIRKYRIYL